MSAGSEFNLNNDTGDIDGEYRPWGYYEILDDKEDHKVKRITVYPGKRLSLQRHKRRQEHWYFISGEGIVTLDMEEVAVQPGKSVDIDFSTVHRVSNTGSDDLKFIEVQRGDYFGEDDIERLEDDFGRS
ncbi:MAG: phosphomannose isomerase type II C-terminal cupin domain [Spirochaetota bacterium]